MTTTPLDIEPGYTALRQGAGIIPRHELGRLRLTGADRADLLHRTSTGDLRGLAAGAGAQTIIQTETAKVIDWLAVYERGQDMLVVAGPGRGAEAAAWIDKIVIMDDVTVEDITATTGLLEICGPLATDVAAGLAGEAARTLAPHAHITFELGGGAITLAAGRPQEPPYFRIIAPLAALDVLIQRLGELGAVPASASAAEALRAELGVPAVGHELTLDANPLEARLHKSISFDKGCYTGQEVIAKMITYKSTKRTLVGYRLPDGVSAPSLDHWHPVRQGSEVVGRLTTVAWSPGLQHWIGLGLLKTQCATPGTRLRVDPANHPAGGGPKLGSNAADVVSDSGFEIVTAALPFDLS